MKLSFKANCIAIDVEGEPAEIGAAFGSAIKRMVSAEWLVDSGKRPSPGAAGREHSRTDGDVRSAQPTARCPEASPGASSAGRTSNEAGSRCTESTSHAMPTTAPATAPKPAPMIPVKPAPTPIATAAPKGRIVAGKVIRGQAYCTTSSPGIPLSAAECVEMCGGVASRFWNKLTQAKSAGAKTWIAAGTEFAMFDGSVAKAD